jgi:hypothetical protein
MPKPILKIKPIMCPTMAGRTQTATGQQICHRCLAVMKASLDNAARLSGWSVTLLGCAAIDAWAKESKQSFFEKRTKKLLL